MRLPRALALAAALGATASLAAGLAAGGRPLVALAALPLALTWAGTLLPRLGALAPLCLAASVALAAAGLLCGAPTVLMWLGATAALAAWDLVLLARAAARPSRAAAEPPPAGAPHLRALVFGLASGLALACLGRLARIELPFVAMLALAVVATGGLERVVRVRWRG